MVYMLFSMWHFPSLGSTMPPSLPSPAKWNPASVENTNRRVTFLQPICSCEEEEEDDEWGKEEETACLKTQLRRRQLHMTRFHISITKFTTELLLPVARLPVARLPVARLPAARLPV